MNEQINKIQAVINTLNTLSIVSEHDTMMKILGCQNALAEVKNALTATAEIKGVEPDGNADAE